jgi:hypothetical protein
MRLLCDEMLGRLARLIRAAGYDTTVATPGTPDPDLLKTAEAEGRILITRDRRLAEAAGPRGLLLRAGAVNAQARAVGEALDLDWLRAPFTRCLMDNTRLREANPSAISALPDTVRQGAGPFRVCPTCRRRYWPGSHVRRMLETLDGLNRPGTGVVDAVVREGDPTDGREGSR